MQILLSMYTRLDRNTPAILTRSVIRHMVYGISSVIHLTLFRRCAQFLECKIMAQ